MSSISANRQFWCGANKYLHRHFEHGDTAHAKTPISNNQAGLAERRVSRKSRWQFQPPLRNQIEKLTLGEDQAISTLGQEA
jgi:hypothetical protein